MMLTLIKLESKSKAIANQISSLNGDDDSLLDEVSDELESISERSFPQQQNQQQQNYYNQNQQNQQQQSSCNLHICHALKESMAASVKVFFILIFL